MKTITPWILGSGMASKAAAKALACLRIQHPELNIADFRLLAREESFTRLTTESGIPLLIICNPHGLHAPTILRAISADIRHIVTEKPACVNLIQIAELKDIQAKVAVLHVYRHMWGPQTIKTILTQGQLGDIIAIEGKYWQSSTAERALRGKNPSNEWKNNVALSGSFDVYLDIASHWLDMVAFLFGETPKRIQTWLSHKNSLATHRDSHVQLSVDFPSGGRGFGSVSKTAHGATNNFEINVLGTKGSVAWTIENPDVIVKGAGMQREILTRQTTTFGSEQPPFHGTGWLEGYIEIMRQKILEIRENSRNYPTLEENLILLEAMFNAEFGSF